MFRFYSKSSCDLQQPSPSVNARSGLSSVSHACKRWNYSDQLESRHGNHTDDQTHPVCSSVFTLEDFISYMLLEYTLLVSNLYLVACHGLMFAVEYFKHLDLRGTAVFKC